MSASFQDKIVGALKTVRNKRTGYDVVDSEMVRDIATTTDGKIRLSLLMTANDDAELVRDVRKALENVDGATDVRVDVKPAPADPESGAAQQGMPKPPTPQSRALPGIGQEGPTKQNGPPPQTP